MTDHLTLSVPRNCLFRAFADQLPYRHDNLRRTVVRHMRENEADYAPFVEDDVTFEEYSEPSTLN